MLSLATAIEDDDRQAVKLLVARLANLGIDERDLALLFEPAGHSVAEGVAICGLGGREDLDAIITDGHVI